MMERLTRREVLGMSAAAAAGLCMGSGALPTLFAPPAPAAAATPDDTVFDRISGAAQYLLSDRHLPGLAIGVIVDDELVFGQGFGTKDLRTGAPMSIQSVQSQASVSKAFAGTAIMQLVERGKVNIDNPFTRYVPYFRLSDPRYSQITVRHLLAHNSGLPFTIEAGYYEEFMDPWYGPGSAERYVRLLARSDITLLNNPGDPTAFNYSDMGYDILADLIHKVSGELFEDYCRRHIFEPLGMTDTSFLLREVDPSLLVAAHVLDAAGNPVVWDYFPYDRKHAPSSCLHSSIVDLSRWLRAHLNGGRLGNVRILKPASQAQLWEPLNWMDEWTAYGWGWELWEWAGWPVASMFGGQPGTQTGYAAVRCGKGQGLMVMGNLDTLETPWYAGDFMFGTGGSVAAIDELVCATCGCPPAAAGATGVRRPVGQYARKPAAMGPDGHAVYLPVVEKQ